MSPLRFTMSLILPTSTMLEPHLSTWSGSESIQPWVDYLSKWPQQGEREEAGVNLCSQESTSEWGRLTAKQRPSLTHAHLLALVQKRLRIQGATAGDETELQTQLIVQTTDEKKRGRERQKWNTNNKETQPNLQTLKHTNISIWNLQRLIQGFPSRVRSYTNRSVFNSIAVSRSGAPETKYQVLLVASTSKTRGITF